MGPVAPTERGKRVVATEDARVTEAIGDPWEEYEDHASPVRLRMVPVSQGWFLQSLSHTSQRREPP